MSSGSPAPEPAPPSELLRQAEVALRRFGYAKIPAVRPVPGVEPAFWVQEPGVPRRTFPVFVEGAGGSPAGWDRVLEPSPSGRSASRAIVVVPSDREAEDAYRRGLAAGSSTPDSELSILVMPGTVPDAHWHAAILPPRELLRLATGVVVGLFRRAQTPEGGPVDFEEMLQILRDRFRIDVPGSLGVEGDEDALFMLYQLAQRDSYAPGDAAANLHALVLRPNGPAARLPWFAA